MTKKSEKIYANKIDQTRVELFNRLWGEEEISQIPVWDRKTEKGFTTVPRALPYVCSVIDYLSDKGKPTSQIYLSLWFRNSDQGLIEIKNEKELAFEGGFRSNRAVTTWKNRMKKLKELGFIKSMGGSSSDYQYIILVNPFKVIRGLQEKLPQELSNALSGRMSEVKAEW